MLSFLIYITVTSITPGPSNLFIMLSSKTFGIKGASRFIAGILAGFLFLACLSLVLLYTLNDLLPEIQSVLKYSVLYTYYILPIKPLKCQLMKMKVKLINHSNQAF